MGRQVQFKFGRADVDRFEAWYFTTGDVCVLAQPTSSEALVESPTLRPEDAPAVRPWGEVLLARRVDLPLIRVNHVKAQGYYLVDKLRSPIVEFGPSYDLQTGLPRTGKAMNRIWYPTSYWDDERNLVKMPDDFLAWAAKLLRWVRRNRTHS